jgi:hypothetical protein
MIGFDKLRNWLGQRLRFTFKFYNSLYFWFGVVPLVLALLLLRWMFNTVPPEKIHEHLLSEAIAMLTGIPLINLLVETGLKRRGGGAEVTEQAYPASFS